MKKYLEKLWHRIITVYLYVWVVVEVIFIVLAKAMWKIHLNLLGNAFGFIVVLGLFHSLDVLRFVGFHHSEVMLYVKDRCCCDEDACNFANAIEEAYVAKEAIFGRS